MRWPKHRQHYISCFCCPPNTVRTLCEAQEYVYSINKDTLWVNLYGQNSLKTKDLEVDMQSNYPWDGHITLTIQKAKTMKSIRMHIPGWSTDMTLKLNGAPILAEDLRQPRKWKKGDVIELDLPMKARLVEANPLVEESKNQVAVMRGPIVYCLEGQDIEGNYRINDIAIPTDIQFTEKKITISGHEMTALEGDAVLVNQDFWDNNSLYRDLRLRKQQKVRVRLIPYYAWDNRGIQDMSVWLNRGL